MPPRVLLVTPDRSLAELLSSELIARGLEVETAASEAVALPRLGEGLSVALVDDRIESRGSLRVLDTIRRRAAATTAVLWLAQRVTQQTAELAVAAGAQEVVARPVELPRLLDAIVRAAGAGGDEVDRRIPIPASPQSGVLERLLGQESVRTIPGVVHQVLQLTGDDGSGATELEQVIASDPNATASVLKAANASAVAAAGRVTRVRDAIVRLGFRRVRSLILGLSVVGHFDREVRDLGFDPTEFWKASIGSSLFSRRLAVLVGHDDPETAYLCGLVHRIGMNVCDEFLAAEFERAVGIALDQGVGLLDAERAVLGIDHLEVGQALLSRWKFPDEICAVAGLRRRDIAAHPDERVRTLARIVSVADGICRALAVGNAVERTIEAIDPADLAALGIDEQLDDEFLSQTAAEIDAALEIFLSAPPIFPDDVDDERFYFFYEEEPSPVSLPRIALQGAGALMEPFELAHLDRMPPDRPALLHFRRAATLRQAAAAHPLLATRRCVFLLPQDELPRDDATKRAVGLPVGCGRYLTTPIEPENLVMALVLERRAATTA